MTLMDKSAFVAAKRAEIDRLEALARELLDAHPEPESIDKEEEADWRELAHAARQMRPLLEALERADAAEPGFEQYRRGVDFRLTEAITAVATLCAYGRLNTIPQRKTARKDRPNAKNPFTKFIEARLKLKRNATGKEIETALFNDAVTVRAVNSSFRMTN